MVFEAETQMSSLMFQKLPANPAESMNAAFVKATQTHCEDLLVAVFASFNYNRDTYYNITRLSKGDGVYGSQRNSRQVALLNKQLCLVDYMKYDAIEKEQILLTTSEVPTVVDRNEKRRQKVKKHYALTQKEQPPKPKTGKIYVFI